MNRKNRISMIDSLLSILVKTVTRGNRLMKSSNSNRMSSCNNRVRVNMWI